ncbi:hypothetical protein [uncultured Ramlibacter sp.]|uniref:hypothetical protein n=1 Tax=uncultured Ramlibacter sp. TaxID=260755 RepID=UPI00262558E7|nr:hypothetical protein [uncultured Ramlibacter sp.]
MIAKMYRLAPVAVAIFAFGASANAADESAFTFSGFGTVGLTTTNTNDADYVIVGQPHGATKKASGEVDSKLGVQGTYKLNSTFSGTGQLLTKQNGDGNFKPELEWAYVKAQVSPTLALRAGRMGAPMFAVSDFRDVGYANVWLRPPQEVYGQVPISHIDGVDAVYQMPLGTSNVSAQVFAGQSSSVYEHNDLDVKKLVGVNLVAELANGVSLRFGHAQGKLTLSHPAVNGLVSLLRTTPYASVGNQMDATDKGVSFTGIGASYDQNNIIANFEYTKRRTDSFVPDTTGWYTTFGYRFGKFAPYVTLSQVKQDDSNVVNTVPGGALKTAVDYVLADQVLNQKTTALGVRWDAVRNVALKAQYEHVRPDGNGMFANVKPGSGFGKDAVNVFSVSADFVF